MKTLLTPFNKLDLENFRNSDIVLPLYEDPTPITLIKSLMLVYSRGIINLLQLNDFITILTDMKDGASLDITNILQVPILKYSFQHIYESFREGKYSPQTISEIINNIQNFVPPIYINPSTNPDGKFGGYKNSENFRKPELSPTNLGNSLDVIIKNLNSSFIKGKITRSQLSMFNSNLQNLKNGNPLHLQDIEDIPILKYSFEHLQVLYNKGNIVSLDIDRIIQEVVDFELIILSPTPTNDHLLSNHLYQPSKNFRLPSILIPTNKDLGNFIQILESAHFKGRISEIEIFSFRDELYNLIDGNSLDLSLINSNSLLKPIFQSIRTLYKELKISYSNISDFADKVINFPPPLSVPITSPDQDGMFKSSRSYKLGGNLRKNVITEGNKNSQTENLLNVIRSYYNKGFISEFTLNIYRIQIHNITQGVDLNLEGLESHHIFVHSLENLKVQYNEGTISNTELLKLIVDLGKFKIPLSINPSLSPTGMMGRNFQYKNSENIRTFTPQELKSYQSQLYIIRSNIMRGLQDRKLTINDINRFKNKVQSIIDLLGSGYEDMFSIPVLFYSLKHIENMFDIGKYTQDDLNSFLISLQDLSTIVLPPTDFQDTLQTYKNYKPNV